MLFKNRSEAIVCNELNNSQEKGLELLLLTRQLFDKIVGTECHGLVTYV